MATTIKLRRGTGIEHESFIGDQGELTFETDANRLRIHDGETSGGIIVPKEDISIQIGQPFPIWTNLEGVSEPNNDGPYSFIKLSASDPYNNGLLVNESVIGGAPLIEATAEINVGPLAGQIVHLVNTEGAFIRPSEVSGVLQMDQMQRLSGTVRTESNSGDGLDHFTDPSGALTTSGSGGDGVQANGGGQGDARFNLTFDSANSPQARVSSSTDGETRPKNVNAIFYMRIS